MVAMDRADPIDQLAAMAQSLPGDGLVVVTTAAAPFPATPALGLARPADGGPLAGMMRYMGVNMALEDYMPSSSGGVAEGDRESVIARLLEEHDRSTYLHVAAELAATIVMPTSLADLQGAYREFLESFRPACVPLFDAAMRQPNRSFLGRHALLRTAREVLARPETASPRRALPPRMALVMAVHAMAGRMDSTSRAQGATLSGMPEDLALSLVCNQSFHVVEDLYSLVDRQLRLWHDYGQRVKSSLGGREPVELFTAATGAELEDFLALGFALYAHFMAWRPGGPIRLNDDFTSDMPAAVRASFVAHVSNDLDDMAARCATTPLSDWDLLPFQERPVLHLDEGLLVLDGVFLTERFTSGLFWLVNDYLNKSEGSEARKAWTRAWGQMVEAMAEDDLRPHAPQLLGDSRTFFDEEAITAAYAPRTTAKRGQRPKASDCAIDFGSAVGVFEVVSGRLVNATRLGADRSSFEADMEKILLKKVRQLDATARNLRAHPELLFGQGARPRPVQPVVVAGEEFPISLVVTRYVDEYCDTNGFLRGPGIRKLAIIDVGDLEALEGLAEGGHPVIEVLAGWQKSDLAEFSLRNYLLEQYPWKPELYRPRRMQPRVEPTLKALRERLRVRGS